MRVHHRIWPKVAAIYATVYIVVVIVAAAHWGL